MELRELKTFRKVATLLSFKRMVWHKDKWMSPTLLGFPETVKERLKE